MNVLINLRLKMQKRSKLPDGMHDQHSLFIQGMLAHSLNGYLLRNRTGINSYIEEGSAHIILYETFIMAITNFVLFY